MSSSRDRFRAAKQLDGRLNSEDNGDPNLRPFPLPRKAEPLRALCADQVEAEAPSVEEPARRLLATKDLEDFLRDFLEHCLAPARPQGSEDPAAEPRRPEGELPDRFREGQAAEDPRRFKEVRLRKPGDPWRCSFCLTRSDKMEDRRWPSSSRYGDRFGTLSCRACLPRAERGEEAAPPRLGEEPDPWDDWDPAEFRRRAERWGQKGGEREDGEEPSAPSLGEGPFWEAVPLGALSADEAAREGEPPPRRRRCSEERRERLFRWLAIPGHCRYGGEAEREKYAPQEKVERNYRAAVEVYAAFVAGSKAAVAELRAAAACGEERPTAGRSANLEPEERGWATAGSSALRAEKLRRVLPEAERLEKARKLGVRDEFFKSLQEAAEALEALASSEAGAVSRKCESRAIPESVAEQLKAPSKAERLAEKMAAAERPIYARACGVKEMEGPDCSLTKLCSLFVQASPSGLRGGPFQSCSSSRAHRVPFRMLNSPAFSYGWVTERCWFHPFRQVELAADPGDAEANRKAGLAERLSKVPCSVFLDAHSKAYDGSVDLKLFQLMRQVSPFRRIFRLSANVWDALLEEERQQDAPGSPPGTASRPGTAAGAEAQPRRPPPPQGPKVPEKFFGVRLGDVAQLVEQHKAWFEEERWCKFSKRNRKKTMYDVCPELIIPATTCQERIVTLQAEDMPKLCSRFDDPPGILHSQSDLTICPSLGTVRLGGADVPAGLTMHGKLVKGGAIRREYWKLGPERDSQWRTLACHGREQRPVREVAPIPKELLRSGGPLGEASDRVWQASELQAGDAVVLRRGVSYIDMVAGDGPHHELDSFASHFWGEETVDFLRTLVKHAETLEQQGGVKALDRCYYICTFNNNQHRVELGSSWRTSPFNRALEFVAGMAVVDTRRPRDAVMVFDSEAKPLQRKWCVFEAWRCTELDLPLRLYCPDGEITRNAIKRSKVAEEVLRMVAEIDVAAAGCSVKADADMIDRAIEDAPGGFAAVHAKLRTRVLDLMTFIGSLAVSVDPMTGRRVEEVELHVRGRSPGAVEGRMLPARDIAADMCGAGGALGRNVLLVAPAGSGKSVFTRALVRHAVEASHANAAEGLPEVLPVRVPLAELAKTVKRIRSQAKTLQKKLAVQLVRRKISQQEYDKRFQTLDQPDFSGVFDAWAQRAFLRDSGDVTTDKEGRQRLLILDGFDEAGHSRAEIISWLRAYVQKHSAVRTLLTTRPSGLDGVSMSTGRVRGAKHGRIQHVDGAAGLVNTSEPYPVSTLLELECEDGAVDCCVDSATFVLPRSDVLQRLRPGWSVLKAQGGALALDYAYCLKPLGPDEAYEVELLPAEGGSAGVARGILEVRDESTVVTEIRKRKEGKRLDQDYQPGVHDVVSVTVIQSAEGHKVGGLVKIPKESLQRHSPAAVAEDLKAVKQDLAALAIGDSDMRERLERKKVQLERLKGRLEKTKEEGQDLMLKVTEDLRYLRLRGLRDGRPVNMERLRQGGEAKEMLIRDQLVRELQFSDFEIDTITADAAAAIARNVGGEALQSFHREMLDKFAPNLWDRPLLANLFGQFLQAAGVERALELSSAVAELEIFRFITEKLIRQAAAVVAPNSREETVKQEYERIHELLMETSRQKMNRNERLWHKANLRDLYEDAIRGHFRLFEPQEGNEDSRPVQFYHYRIQELLAAEAWNQSGLSLESASRLMVQKDALVATGLAPLKFLAQAKLSQQVDERRLVLDFLSDGERSTCDKRLVTTISEWLPPLLEELELHFPPVRNGRDPMKLDKLPLTADFQDALPSSLKVCTLDFQACKIDDSGLGFLGLGRLEKLERLELNMNKCKEVSEHGLANLTSSLPESLKLFALEARGEQNRRRPTTLSTEVLRTFASSLPRGLVTLRLDLSALGLGDESLRGLGEELPRGLRELSIAVQDCDDLQTEGLAGFCERLPPGLGQLRLDFRSCDQVARWGEALGAALPGGLEALELLCNARARDGDARGLGAGLPPGLRSLALDLRLAASLRDAGLEALGARLPRGLERLALSCRLCQGLSAGPGALRCGLPAGLQELALDFSVCRLLSEEGLLALGAALPPGLARLDVDVSSCRGLADRGLLGLCAALPASLRRLRLGASGSDGVGDEGLLGLGRGLPRGLEALRLECSRCAGLSSAGPAGLCARLPPGLRRLELLLARCHGLDDAALALQLPPGLGLLELDASHCAGLGAEELEAEAQEHARALERHHAAAEAERQAHAAEARRYEEQLAEAAREGALLRDRHSETEASAQRIESDLEEAGRELAKLRAELAEEQRRAAEEAKRLDQARREAATHAKRTEELEAEVKEERAKHIEEGKRWQEATDMQARQFEDAQKEAEEKTRQAEDEVRELSLRLEQVETALQQYKSHDEDMEQRSNTSFNSHTGEHLMRNFKSLTRGNPLRMSHHSASSNESDGWGLGGLGATGQVVAHKASELGTDIRQTLTTGVSFFTGKSKNKKLEDNNKARPSGTLASLSANLGSWGGGASSLFSSKQKGNGEEEPSPGKIVETDLESELSEASPEKVSDNNSSLGGRRNSKGLGMSLKMPALPRASASKTST